MLVRVAGLSASEHVTVTALETGVARVEGLRFLCGLLKCLACGEALFCELASELLLRGVAPCEELLPTTSMPMLGVLIACSLSRGSRE